MSWGLGRQDANTPMSCSKQLVAVGGGQARGVLNGSRRRGSCGLFMQSSEVSPSSNFNGNCIQFA